MKNTARIDDWQVVPIYPEGEALIGKITEHTRQYLFTKERQITSKLVRLDETEKIAETLNTIYTLGEKRV